jgi:hypothetical protein
VKLNGWLRVRQDGTASYVKQKPDVGAAEIAVPLRLEIPDALFAPLVIPIVEVVLDESILPQVKAINQSVEQLQDAGVRVRLVEK